MNRPKGSGRSTIKVLKRVAGELLVRRFMAIVRVNGQGRIVIPNSVKGKSGLREGGYVRIKAEERAIIWRLSNP